MGARWLKLTLAYDGAAYFGWQIQPDKSTVQGVVQHTWHRLTQETLRVTAAGRTDTGVHALGQVVGLQTDCRLSNAELQRGLNALLPADVVVTSVDDAPENFHATHHAKQKRYSYRIHSGRTRPLFDRRYVWHIPHELDDRAMHLAAQHLVGRHDFCSFESAGSARPDTVRTIFQLDVARREQPADERIDIDITADGFLYNMVRAIVGTLVEVGRGKRDPSWPAAVLAARDRRQAGQTAPPHGLFLVSVDY